MKKYKISTGVFLLLAAFLPMQLTGCSNPLTDRGIPITQGKGGEDNADASAAGDKEKAADAEGTAQEDFADAWEESGRLVLAEDLSSYIELGRYKELVARGVQVTDEQVDAAIRQKRLDDKRTVRDAALEAGDVAVINYVGTVASKTFDGSIANNYVLTIGSGEMADGFEDALVGMTAGQTRTFSVQYPEDYFDKTLAGAAVEYRVTLQSFQRPAELTEEWAKEQGAESIESYRESVYQELLAQASKDQEQIRQNAFLQVLEASKIKAYPEEDLDRAKAQYMALVQRYADQADMTLEDFVHSQQITGADFEQEALAYAQNKVKELLVLQQILDEEGISLQGEEAAEVRDKLAQEYGQGDAKALEEAYGLLEVNTSVALELVEDIILGS